MNIFNFLLAIVASVVLAKAPLVNRNHPDLIDNNYIVVMKKGVDPKAIHAYYSSMKATTGKLASGKRGFVRHFQVHDFNAYHVECDEEMLEDIRGNDIANSWVTLQAPIPQGLPGPQTSLPCQADQSTPWGLGRISHRMPGIATYVDVIAPRSRAYMLDTGIRITHQEFGGRAIWGKNFIEGSPDQDEAGHGTATAGIVGGATVGVDNSTLLIAVKVLDKNGVGSTSSSIDGINWAVDNARDANGISRTVINMSLGGPLEQAMNDAIQAAVEAGMAIVVAAGNANNDSCQSSPASAPNAITVGAIDQQDRRSSYSNWGGCVDIFAPGDGIRTASYWSDDAYVAPSGTSVACPHVAGLATLLRAREDLPAPIDVWNRIFKLGTKDRVQDARNSANLIAFNGNPAELEE
ncbi:peptidase S8/S53 domain-containing protein [Biscogniauxia marginata]|nr:peptidase S8/S53 domain-containing protein [Biscogniauxia marginata]